MIADRPAARLQSPILLEIVRCPACHAHLTAAKSALICDACSREYAIHDGVPDLFHPDSEFAGSNGEPAAHASASVHRWSLSALPLTRWLNDAFFDRINQLTPDMLVLNLGSGLGLFDDQIRSDLRLVNLDVYRHERTDILADGHYLPFADATFNAVISNAVLEHVRKPWIVADEIERVLKPGGKAFINVPFLNVIHDERDYYRYTDRGLEALFQKLRKVEGGVSSGPSSFFGPFLVEYLACFVPDGVLRRIARQPLSLLAWPLKYLDVLIARSPHLRVTADAFYYIGVKTLDRAG